MRDASATKSARVDRPRRSKRESMAVVQRWSDDALCSVAGEEDSGEEESSGDEATGEDGSAAEEASQEASAEDGATLEDIEEGEESEDEVSAVSEPDGAPRIVDD